MDFKEKFVGKEILITGGLGFIGSNLAERLVKFGAKVVIVDNCSPGSGFNDNNVEEIKDKVQIFKEDLGKKELVETFVRNKDYIFNLAGHAGHSLSIENPHLDLNANCTSILSLLEACRKINAGVKIVNASTRQIYGNQKELPIKEEAEKNIPDINAIHNITKEDYFRLYEKLFGIKACSLRLTNTFGPKQSLNKYQGFIPRLIKELVTKNEINLPDDFGIKRNFNYVDDVIDAFLITAGHSGIYNLGSEEIVSMENFAKLMINVHGSGSLLYSQRRKENISVNDSYLDFSKIQKTFGWEPKIALSEGLKKTLAFYKEHVNKYV